jgi:hypothetical protein
MQVSDRSDLGLPERQRARRIDDAALRRPNRRARPQPRRADSATGGCDGSPRCIAAQRPRSRPSFDCRSGDLKRHADTTRRTRGLQRMAEQGQASAARQVILRPLLHDLRRASRSRPASDPRAAHQGTSHCDGARCALRNERPSRLQAPACARSRAPDHSRPGGSVAPMPARSAIAMVTSEDADRRAAMEHRTPSWRLVTTRPRGAVHICFGIECARRISLTAFCLEIETRVSVVRRTGPGCAWSVREGAQGSCMGSSLSVSVIARR